MCPHHLMPASGLGTVAFAPHGKLVGLGVMATLLDVCAHRLILQEEIGERVVAALAEELGPYWAACRLVLSHGCVSARGGRARSTGRWPRRSRSFVGDAAAGRAGGDRPVVAGQHA